MPPATSTLAATSTTSTTGLASRATAVDIRGRDSPTSHVHHANYAKPYCTIHSDELYDGGRPDYVSLGHHSVVGKAADGNHAGYGAERAGGVDHRSL